MAERNAALDGVRGIAVAAVVLFHLQLADSGYLGVDVFFVMSGFLITTILVAERDQHGEIRLLRFYVRRALRLYPALVVLVVAVVGLSLVVGESVGPMLRDAAVSLAYVSNMTGLEAGLLDHTWTLSLEEQFYLVWPLVLMVIVGARRRVGLVLALVLVGGLLVADLVAGRDGAMHTYVRAMGLPLGCALALLRGSAVWTRLVWVGPAALAGLGVCFLLPVPAALAAGWPISVGAVLAAPVVAMAVDRRPAWLGSSVLRWLGLRSYSLYLWHFPMIALAEHHAPSVLPHWSALVLGLVGALVAAELSYRYVELRVIDWRDRVTTTGTRESGSKAPPLSAP